ncbi:unnamed protein product [Aureobasidium vineae]|uniref:Uncharacterized protein n=1 Tax=Aureobasidium vineae TaxID=2773715 RepID=A0A9N8JKG4_9PEZI|nr:unnamed protein product [Aureobasidium vineae]
MSYSYATAKAILSEVEKDRILAMYLSSDDMNDVDWDKATQAYGAASVDSMKVSYRNSLKKIEKAGGKTGVTAPLAGGDSSVPSTPKTPKTPKAPKGKGGRPSKRKAENTGSDEDDDDDDDDTPKTLRKKAAKNIVKAQDEDEDEEETTKTPKKAGRPRKTPVKSTTKTAMIKTLGGDEDAAANINVASDNIEPDQEDEQTSEIIKEEDESEC